MDTGKHFKVTTDYKMQMFKYIDTNYIIYIINITCSNVDVE